MASIGYATLQVIPSLKGFNARLRTSMGGQLSAAGADAGKAAGSNFANNFAKFAAGATAIAGIATLGKNFYDAAIESQKVTKQTEAVLKSMGNVAGVSAKDVSDLSEELSLMAGIDDEVIQNSQNVLLTFGKVRNEVGKGNRIFDRATKAALNMSVALGQDLQGATIQIGKALNDPIKGITALSRAGVSFTAQQKEQIRTLAESGRTLDAQKIILSELDKQFGGSAEAQATAADRMKVAWGNVQEELGAYLIPVVEDVATWMAEKLPGAIDTMKGFIDEKLIPTFREDVQPALADTVAAIETLAGWAQTAREWMQPMVDAWNAWLEVIEAVPGAIARALSAVNSLPFVDVGRADVSDVPDSLVRPGSREARRRGISQWGTRTLPRHGGGWIPGWGPDRDSIHAFLTPGEFVVNRAAAKKYAPWLEAINAKKFNDGGWAAPGTVYEDGSVRGAYPDSGWVSLPPAMVTPVEEARFELSIAPGADRSFLSWLAKQLRINGQPLAVR